MKFLVLALLSAFCFSTLANKILTIEVGENYSKYSTKELRQRVWRLERAVFQLQQKVFQLETSSAQNITVGDSWVCKVKAMGEVYVATGGSKAVAEVNAIEKCTKARKDSFFCKNAECNQ